jgi:hypothetical protein
MRLLLPDRFLDGFRTGNPDPARFVMIISLHPAPELDIVVHLVWCDRRIHPHSWQDYDRVYKQQVVVGASRQREIESYGQRDHTVSEVRESNTATGD